MSEAVKVGVRVRPTNKREVNKKSPSIVRMVGTQTVLTNPQNDQQKTFNFDHSFWSCSREDAHFASQEDVFEKLGKGVLENSFEGYNACIFAYGQTGSGKTFTMMGSEELPGLIPRLCTALFEKIASNTNPDLTYHIEVSYMEIYNEKVQDLLSTEKKRKGLRVREHKILGPYVEGLSKLAVTDYKQIADLMAEGNLTRHTAATLMNDQSSRSHAVFTIVMTQKQKDQATKQIGEKVSRLSLVDLAGSERSSKTGATGDRLKEGANINKSLTTLGLVISALADRAGLDSKEAKKKFIPYRDSTLTWLLKDNLGGNSKTVMVATISPAADNFEETLSTLRYADRAKRIVNKAVVNEDPNAKLIRELREELELLRASVGTDGRPVAAVDEAELLATKQKLQETEDLIAEMSQSWEEKLRATESVLAEKQKLLEDHAASVQGQGDHALQVRSKLPHFVSLSDDPLASDITIYTFREGNTTIGREDADADNDIVIWGLGTEAEHCEIQYSVEYDEESEALMEVVILLPYAEHCYVNGEIISEPTRLRQGNVVQLGHTNVFRFNHPTEAERMRKLGIKSTSSASHLQAVFNPAQQLEALHKQEADRLEQEKARVEEERARMEAEKARMLEEHAARLAELQEQERLALEARERRLAEEAAEREAAERRKREREEREREEREQQDRENEALRAKLAELENKMRDEFQRAEEERLRREELERIAEQKAADARARQEEIERAEAKDEQDHARQLRELKEQQEREAAEARQEMERLLAEQERKLQEREEQARIIAEERVRQAELVLQREKAMQEEAMARLAEAEAQLKEQERLATDERARREELERIAREAEDKRMEEEKQELEEERKRARELADKIKETEERLKVEAQSRQQLQSQLAAAERAAEEEKAREHQKHLENERRLQEEAEARVRESEERLKAHQAKLEEERKARAAAEERAKQESLSRELEQASMRKEQAEKEHEAEKRRQKQEAAKRYWMEQLGKGVVSIEQSLADSEMKGAHEEEKMRELERERRVKEERAREYQARVEAAKKAQLEAAQQAEKLRELKRIRTQTQAEESSAPGRRARNDELETEMRRQLLMLSSPLQPDKEKPAAKEPPRQASLSDLRSASTSSSSTSAAPMAAVSSTAVPFGGPAASTASTAASHPFGSASLSAAPAAASSTLTGAVLAPTSPLSPTSSNPFGDPEATQNNPFFSPESSPASSPDKDTKSTKAKDMLPKGHPFSDAPVQPFAAKSPSSVRSTSVGRAADPHPFEELNPLKASPSSRSSQPPSAKSSRAPSARSSQEFEPEPPRRMTQPPSSGRRVSADDAQGQPQQQGKARPPGMTRAMSSGSGASLMAAQQQPAAPASGGTLSAPSSRNQTPEVSQAGKEPKAVSAKSQKLSEKELFKRNMEEGVKKVLAAQQEWDQTKRAEKKQRASSKKSDEKRGLDLPNFVKAASRWGKNPKPAQDDEKPLS